VENQLETKTISYVPIVPFALMLGVISAVIGLISGIIIALIFGSLPSVIPTTATDEFIALEWFRILFSIGSIVIMPIVGFAGGFIQGVIYAALYNFLAPKIGGIQLRFKTEEQTPPQP
jgi:hypothetical protein